MPFLPSIDREDKVPHVLAKFQNGTQMPLLEFHLALLRGDSPFSVKERELMAAYVSSINACRYCYGAHSSVAKLYGVPEQLMVDLVTDLSAADVDDKLKPVFAYIRKLTLTPAQMTQADADAVFAAGWSEQALYDAVQVCCLYNFMNRFVEGLGLTPIPEQFDMEGQMIKQGGYTSMAGAFGIK
jgi:uncharacterized peroxidase-related enzyme